MNVENREEPAIDELSAGTAAAEEKQPDPLDQMRIERDGLKVERDELKELLLRRQAEFDNFRKRTEKERSEYLQYAGMEIVREILPVVDDFDRAMKVGGGSPEYTKGVEMIHRRMYDTLKKAGSGTHRNGGERFRSAPAPGGRTSGNEGFSRRDDPWRISARVSF